MLSLTDRASIERALEDPNLDDDLRALIDRHTDDHTKVFIIQAGDDHDTINAALGFAITGDQAEEPNFDWIEDHDGRWFEIAYGSTRILVENAPSTELGIHYLCLSQFWAET